MFGTPYAAPATMAPVASTFGYAPAAAPFYDAYGAAPVYGAVPMAPMYGAAPVAAKKSRFGSKKASKENRFLDKEYAERVQAETALAYGNYAGATWHDARADRWGVKADKKHFRGYNKGTFGTPYAFHPIAPAAGIAAVQPGAYGTGYSTMSVTTVAPLYADAVQVGLYGAQQPMTAFPTAW